jgi:flagellar protein FlaG
MSQIAAVTALTVQAAAVTGPAVADAAVPPDFRRSVAAAVRHLNESNYAGTGREVQFSIDAHTRLPVVKVVDADTKEVISQLPAEYALELAQSANNTRDLG